MGKRQTDCYLQHTDRVKMVRTVSDEEIAACLPQIRRLAGIVLSRAPYQMDINDLVSAGVWSIMNFAYTYKPGEVPFWFAGRKACKVAMWHEVIKAFRFRRLHCAATDDYEEGKNSRRLENAERYAYPFIGKEMKGHSKEPYASDYIFALIGKPAEPGSVRDKMLKALIDLLTDPTDKLIIKSYYFHGTSTRGLCSRLGCTKGVIQRKIDLALCELRRKVLPISEAMSLCRARHKCSTVATLEVERGHEAFRAIASKCRQNVKVSMIVRLLSVLDENRGGYTVKSLVVAAGYSLVGSQRDQIPSWAYETVRESVDAGLVNRIGDKQPFGYQITEEGINQLRLAQRPVELLPIVSLVA